MGRTDEYAQPSFYPISHLLSNHTVTGFLEMDMQLGKVIGTVVASQKHEALQGIKLLIVQPVTPDGKPKGRAVVAVDGTAMAGPGETVFVIGGREGALVLEKWFTPVDHGIVGIVDDVLVAVKARKRRVSSRR
jgi:ethanolamine utilization protein EutN